MDTARQDPDPRTRSVLGRVGADPRLLALAYVGLSLAFAALGWTGLWSTFSLLDPGFPSTWTLATAIPASSIVLLKRRAPLAGLGLAATVFVADLLTTGGLVPLLVLLELLHAATVALPAARRRRMLFGVIVGTAAIFVAALVVMQDGRLAVLVALQFGALLGLSYWYANSFAQSQELVALYRERAEDAARISELARDRAVSEERDRMARDLHDVVAGHVSAVAIRTEAAIMREPASAGRSGDLLAIRDASHAAHDALRSMIAVLRVEGGGATHPEGSADLAEAARPGYAAIPALIEDARRSGARPILEDSLGELWSGGLPERVDEALGRIVQEALANAVRYAPGSESLIKLDSGDGVVAVEVITRGGAEVSEPVLRGSGMGLQLLDERVTALGGEFDAGREGDAWVVRAAIPIGAKNRVNGGAHE